MLTREQMLEDVKQKINELVGQSLSPILKDSILGLVNSGLDLAYQLGKGEGQEAAFKISKE